MSGAIQSYRDLDAWKLAVAMVGAVYRFTASFPADERFGLTTQLRRASVSVPSNIAEGWGRGSTAEYLRFLRTARGSLYEVETQVIIATQLGFASAAEAAAMQEQAEHVGRVLAGLVRSIESKLDRPDR